MEKRLTHRYSSILEKILTTLVTEYEFKVVNLAMRAAGAMQWILCGIEPSDIVVSEFRLNIGNLHEFNAWYKLLQKSSLHFVVLDLWSALKPPPKLTLSIPSKEIDSKSYSILSFNDMFMDTWHEALDFYFSHPHIKDSAYDGCIHAAAAAAGNDHQWNETELEFWNYCNKVWDGSLQHPNNHFHFDVALALASHIKNIVLPQINLLQEVKGPSLPSSSSSTCFSEWGLKNAEDNATLISFQPWSSAIQYNSDFHVGSPFGIRNKYTLNTNKTSAGLLLTCPDGFNSSAWIGYVKHANKAESGSFEIHKPYTTVSTWMGPVSGNPNRRVKKFIGPVQTPVQISIQEVKQGAFVELTDLVCSRKLFLGG